MAFATQAGGKVRTGAMRVLSGASKALDGKRIGLLVNPTAVDEALVHLVDRIVDERRADVRCLFGPEHGVRGDAQDMIAVGTERDVLTGLPVHSLYGHDEHSLRPRAEMLDGLDAVVYDVQDVGSRYYTFVWTLLHVMEACAPRGVQVIVLDRPNPIGGEAVEGGAIQPGYFSFVGRSSVPNRHGLTAGEVARWVNERHGIGCDLHVVELEGWRRHMLYDATGLPWVYPSPNMPSPTTALVYPGMCLVEGTELSEGRGTTLPFEQVGAPFVDYRAAGGLARALNAEQLPGINFRPLVFTPQFQKHAGKQCGGVALHLTDRGAFLPYLTGIAVVRAFAQGFPGKFQWRTRAYEFVDDKPAFDLLTGGPEVREGIERGDSLARIAATWRDAERAFAAERQACLLY